MHPIDEIDVERAGMAEHGCGPFRKAAMRMRCFVVRAHICFCLRDNRAYYARADAASDFPPQKIACDNMSISIKEFFMYNSPHMY